MKISQNGIQFIKQREGEEFEAYQDSVGIWTIGVGHTKGVRKGQSITPEQSTKFLLDDLASTEHTINDLVTVPLTQNQYDALVSLVFNIGGENFRRSTLLRSLNSRQYLSAAGEFVKWNKGTKNGKKVVINGLTIRRKKEENLFLS